ncbi:MAG: TusE/DsrC/DsvC family sulfur relay protein, partial [Xanthomonadales bacterium]|nr:TusE/DsrC/DsvC family sulfur relay protein [Xanthomonadales bacterium]
MAYELNGTTYEADEEGYLKDLSAWSPELAVLIAEDENIEMSDDAWEVV